MQIQGKLDFQFVFMYLNYSIDVAGSNILQCIFKQYTPISN